MGEKRPEGVGKLLWKFGTRKEKQVAVAAAKKKK
jgi:hypothetical protein